MIAFNIIPCLCDCGRVHLSGIWRCRPFCHSFYSSQQSSRSNFKQPHIYLRTTESSRPADCQARMFQCLVSKGLTELLPFKPMFSPSGRPTKARQLRGTPAIGTLKSTCTIVYNSGWFLPFVFRFRFHRDDQMPENEKTKSSGVLKRRVENTQKANG